MTFRELVNNVHDWADKRGIYEYSTKEMQLLKTLSEVGEIADALAKNDRDALIDAIGDTVICLINYAKMAQLNIDTITKKSVVNDDKQHASAVCEVSRLLAALSKEMYNVSTRYPYKFNSFLHFALPVKRLCTAKNLDFMHCCETAWDVIKDRTGHMVEGGTWVKDKNRGDI